MRMENSSRPLLSSWRSTSKPQIWNQFTEWLNFNWAKKWGFIGFSSFEIILFKLPYGIRYLLKQPNLNTNWVIALWRELRFVKLAKRKTYYQHDLIYLPVVMGHRDVLVLLNCEPILVRLDCYSHSRVKTWWLKNSQNSPKWAQPR